LFCFVLLLFEMFPHLVGSNESDTPGDDEDDTAAAADIITRDQHRRAAAAHAVRALAGDLLWISSILFCHLLTTFEKRKKKKAQNVFLL
jgi:hypothetical protein